MNLIVLVAALVVSWLVLTWLLQVAQMAFKKALAIAAIVLVLQLGFGIGPQQLFEQILQLPQLIEEMLTGQS
jgi:Flp pilus assembly protein TadB